MAAKKLPRFVWCLTKDSHSSLLSQNVALPVSRRNFTKWKKIKSVCGCSAFTCQQRKIGGQSESLIVKSPFRHLEIPNVTVPDLLWEKIDRFADYTAIECGVTGRKYSFAQIKNLSHRFAVSLLKSGIQQGQTVAFISQNCPEYPIVVFGCMEAGIVVTPINYIYTPDEICHQLKDSGAVCVVAPLDILNTAIAAITKVKESNKSNKEIKVIGLDTSEGEIPSGVGRFSELVADHVDGTELRSLRSGSINTSELAILPYSSGTTGLAKGVQLSHLNLVSNILQISDEAAIIETTKDHQDVFPGILPFYHIYGFTTIMSKSILFGSKVVTLKKFEPQTFLEVLKNHKCSIMYIVPPLILFLSSSKDVTTEHFRYVRNVISGAAPLGVSDVQRFLDKMPKENNVDFRQAYGLTESSPCISLPPANSNYATIGAPVSNTLMKVISVENGDNLGPNQNGEVCAKGPQIMLGYHNNPKATAATIDSDRWLHTGDIGYYDENGLFYIVDRIKELIKVKGFQVPPAELEEMLRSLPGVKDAGVVGVADERSGEVPIAFVVQSLSNPASVSDIKTFMSQKVALYKQLSDIVFVDAIPKSASGKILRREIKETYLKKKQKNIVK